MKNKKIEPNLYTMIDNEEIYLNQMCEKGWKPVEIFLGIFFCFERCEPGEYIARVTTTMDTEKGRSTKEKRRFLTEYLTDSGAEIVHETNIDAGSRIYAVRPAALGPFEINTDTDSLIADYQARRKFHIIWTVIAGVLFLMAMTFGVLFTREAMELGDSDIMRSAYIEFASAALLLVCFIAVVIPIGKYNRKIRQLREKREFEE